MLEEAIRSRDFQSVVEAINKGEKLPSTLDKYTRKLIFDILVNEKKFDILTLFAVHKIIETDIYEYENFDYSIFDSLLNFKLSDEQNEAFFEHFLEHFTNINDEINGETLLSYAFTRNASLRNLKTLLEFGCNANFKNNQEENIIHQLIKADFGRPNLARNEYEELLNEYIKLLISNGAEVDDANTKKETPLISALRFRKDYFLPVLLEHGADPNHTDSEGNNAFYYAIIWDRSIDAYRKLCEYQSPELNETNNLGETVLFNYLKEINFDSIETNLEIIKQLLNDGADLYVPCNYYGESKTPLECAAGKSAEILNTIIETGGVDLNRQDDNGNTILHKVCAYNVNEDHEKAKETYRKVKLLLEKGADPKIKNDKDQTALMLASDDNYKIKTVELLMKQP